MYSLESFTNRAELYSIDLTTGASTRIPTGDIVRVPNNNAKVGLVWDGSNLLLVTATDLYEIDRTTGIPTKVGSGTRFELDGFGFAPRDGGVVYDDTDVYIIGQAGAYSSGIVLAKLDTTDASLELVDSTFGVARGIDGIEGFFFIPEAVQQFQYGSAQYGSATYS